MAGLTVDEARTRAQSIEVSSYDVSLDLTRGAEQFGSRSTIRFTSRDQRPTFLDLKPAELVSATLNGTSLDTTALADGRLPLTDLAADNVLEVDAAMAYSHDGEGLHRATDPHDGEAYVYAMSFLDAAPRIFACFDQPDLKAPFRLSVDCPPEWTVVGNGAAEQAEPGRWRLAETKPLATYFVTLAAGPYHSVVRDHDEIRLGWHCRRSLAPHLDKDADELFDLTGRFFDEYHRLFGIRYPFGDYNQVFVPEFNAGAMENPGCVTFSERLLFTGKATRAQHSSRANTIAHEMAHMWFGDLVTMRWWDDLWLNESFADYMGFRLCGDLVDHDESWVTFALAKLSFGFAADQRSSTHPVAGNGAKDTESALNDFDGISYTKGAAVLRQLAAYLGDDAFLAGVVDHLQRRSFGNATLADLLGSWAAASGKDVDGWAKAWLRTSGLDTLSVAKDDGGSLRVGRETGSTPPIAKPHSLTVGWYRPGADGSTTPLLVDADQTPLRISGYNGTGLVLPNAGDETWAKVRLDPAVLSEAATLLGAVDDPVARAVVWGALREALLDSVLDPRHYLDAVVSNLADEPVDLLVEIVLRLTTASFGGTGVLGTYLGAYAREPLAGLSSRLLDEAVPGSNRQLIAARSLAATAVDLDSLRSWLEGNPPDGVSMDPNMRWRVVHALAADGQIGQSEIDAELERDNTLEGRRHAYECRAALPDPDVKAEVWAAMTTDASLSNEDLYSLGGDFFHPWQRSLTDEYVPRYFAEMTATSGFRSGMVVETSLRLAFPRYAADPETVALADRTLADQELTPGVARAIADATDDLRRVVRSRQAFPS